MASRICSPQAESSPGFGTLIRNPELSTRLSKALLPVLTAGISAALSTVLKPDVVEGLDPDVMQRLTPALMQDLRPRLDTALYPLVTRWFSTRLTFGIGLELSSVLNQELTPGVIPPSIPVPTSGIPKRLP
jgi:hypothetical protein